MTLREFIGIAIEPSFSLRMISHLDLDTFFSCSLLLSWSRCRFENFLAPHSSLFKSTDPSKFDFRVSSNYEL